MIKVLVAATVLLVCLDAFGLEITGIDTNQAREVRISGLWAQKSMPTVLADVLMAYGIHAVVIVRPEDSEKNNKDRRDLMVKDCSPKQFFAAITNAYPMYAVDYDAGTDCWFIAPDDEMGAIFKQVVVFPTTEAMPFFKMIEVCMDKTSITRRIPNVGESLPSDSGEREIPFYLQHPITKGATTVVARLHGTHVRWKAIANVLQNIPRSYIFVCSLLGPKSLIEAPVYVHEYGENSTVVFPEDEPMIATVKDRRVVPNVSITYWSAGCTMDFSSLSDKEICDAFFSDTWREVRPQLHQQLARMSEQRLLGLYQVAGSLQRRRGLFLSLLDEPLFKYTDAAIRIAIDFLRNDASDPSPLHVLLWNCYAPEMIELVSALIEDGSLEWKGRAHWWVLYSPAGISKYRRDAWLEMMEAGYQYKIASEVKKMCSPRSERVKGLVSPEMLAALQAKDRIFTQEEQDKMRADEIAWQRSPERLRYNERARDDAERLRQKHLQVLGIYTNRSFSWVWNAAGISAPDRVKDSH